MVSLAGPAVETCPYIASEAGMDINAKGGQVSGVHQANATTFRMLRPQ
jgi:hypothetical protein